MSKNGSVSDRALVDIVRKAMASAKEAEKAKQGLSYTFSENQKIWVDLSSLQALLPNEPGLRQQLEELVQRGNLEKRSGWKGHSDVGVFTPDVDKGTLVHKDHYIVGYDPDNPCFRVP